MVKGFSKIMRFEKNDEEKDHWKIKRRWED